ncbi:MAG: hypothetical protein AAF567_16000 [Actinomycetota bacterium]
MSTSQGHGVDAHTGEEDPGEPDERHGYRTYEVYQRERVGETTNLISPRQLVGDDYLSDPYALVDVLRENYPCYRDWVGNRFWITRYDDVTSVLADTANYESRPRAHAYLAARNGRSLWGELVIEAALKRCIDDALDQVIGRVLDGVADVPDLATSFAARLPLELWSEAVALEPHERSDFARRLWRMHRGAGWDPIDRVAGAAAFDELADFFDARLRRSPDGDDLVSAAARLGATGHDLVVTLLEADHETLHGGLANLWFQLVGHPGQLQAISTEPRLMKFAWLEALRHSPAVIHAERFARHEVERFGRLLPEGALLWCSTAAANRDPRVFNEPDTFRVDRTDLCQREPRGQYRADGLPSGIAIGLGLPSIQPARPKERPRSRYALTEDIAVRASRSLLERWPAIALAEGASPSLRSLRLGDMHTCWSLPVTLA